MSRKILSLTLSISLLFQYSGFAQTINLADYLSRTPNTVVLDRFRPLSLRYFSYEPSADNFKILLDKGDQKDLSDIKIKDEADRLLTYFKIGLSLPNEKFWVNLRPDAEDQIIDPELEKTDLGKALLEADLQLKKDTSSLTSPQSKEGKAYWEKLYKKAGELFGTENITIPTITRPWIVPGEIIVRESKDSAYIYKAVLKVMLEEDYLSFQPSAISSQQYVFSDPRLKELNKYSTELIRETILPELIKRINSSKDYASLRQVFFSLILARWFKDKYQGYSVGNGLKPFPAVDSGDLTNLTSKESWSKTTYFNEYKKSFNDGEYNLSEKVHTPGGQVIRRYTSGGMRDFMNGKMHSYNPGTANSSIAAHRNMVEIEGAGTLINIEDGNKTVLNLEAGQRNIQKTAASAIEHDLSKAIVTPYITTALDSKTLKNTGKALNEFIGSDYGGATVLENGDLLLPNTTRFPNEENIPLGKLVLPRYVKIAPLAYNFFSYYLGKGEFQRFADRLEKTKVILARSDKLGERHYKLDKENNTISIEIDFMESLLHLGLKRVTIGLFAQALTELDSEFDPERGITLQQQEAINRIAQVSKATGNQNRLEDAIKLFNLKKDIRAKKRHLTDAEKKFWLIDQMENTRSFNGRRAAEALIKEFGYFGSCTIEEAENLLREVARENSDIIVVNEYRMPPGGEDSADKFKDKTATFLMKGSYLADNDLIEGRSVVSDFEMDARDAALFGGKSAYTGMMQHTPGAITLPAFATSGQAFKKKLIAANPGYDAEFKGFARSMQEEIESRVEMIKEKLSQDRNKSKNDITNAEVIKHPDYNIALLELTRKYSKKFQELLEWDKSKISGDLVVEIRENLRKMGKRLGISARLLILAIRSSALGEDSEAASFAGRQDSSLFVMILKMLKVVGDAGVNLDKLTSEINHSQGKPWEQLKAVVEVMKEAKIPVYIDESQWGKSVEPWNAVLQALVNELKRQDEKLGPVADGELDVFIKEWVANQRSLFNARSLDYRLRQNPPLPVYSDEVEMSSLFQKMGFFDIGTVGFGVNRSTGMPEITMGLIEGATNALVSNTGTPDNIFINLKGEVVTYQTADDRRGRQVPNFLNIPIIEEGKEAVKGTLTLESLEGLEGKPVTTDWELLEQIGIVGKTMYEYYGMYPDFEGGFTIRRDNDGRPLHLKDSAQPDGIARDHAGNKRYQWVFSYTQVRPETVLNLKDPTVITLRYKDMSDEDVERLRKEGKVLYENPSYHSEGAAVGPIQWIFKDKPGDWHKATAKIMVSREGTPDMDPVMHMAAAIITLIGGPQSHTAIMSQEFDWIVITGLSDVNKLYNGRIVTVVASKGIVFDGDHSKLLKPMGNDFRPQDLPLLPSGFRLGLNVSDRGRAQKSRSLALWPSYYGPGLVRLEMLLKDIGIMSEGAARYDNYLYLKYLTKLEKEGLTSQERAWLNQALSFNGEVKSLKPYIKNGYVILRQGTTDIEISPLEFYRLYLDDKENPPYSLDNLEDKKQIAVFEKKTLGWLTAEERYVTILSQGLAAIADTSRVWPEAFMNLAQRIGDPDLQEKAMQLAEAYKQSRNQLRAQQAQDTSYAPEAPDYYIKHLKSLYSQAQDKDKFLLSLMIDLMKKQVYIRIDDRKSDEQEKVPGSRVIVDRNPMSGYRGLRMTLDNPRAAKMLLRSIKEMVDKGQDIVNIFGPVVYDEKHFVELVKLAQEVGIDFEKVKFGIMTETPQSIEIRPFLEAGIQFTSTGGNDLLQFSKAVDRMMMGAPWFKTLNNRALSIIRMLATLANETKRWNKNKGLVDTDAQVTDGFCGDWPSNDPVGALTLYVLGFDSASLTLPKIEKTANNIFTILNHLYGHDIVEGQKVLRSPKDKTGKDDREQIARDLLKMIDNTTSYQGLPSDIVSILPALKVALQERHYNIYDEIKPQAKPEVISGSYNTLSITELRKGLPFHYRLLEDFDAGKLDVKSSPEELTKQYYAAKEEKDNLQAKYEKLVKHSQHGEEIPAEVIGEAADLLNQGIARLISIKRDIYSIELKNRVVQFLNKQGYKTEKGNGKKYYINNSFIQVRQAAKEALRKGESFFLETANETSDTLRSKAGAGRYELQEEANPELGNRGMKKNLNPDRGVFIWDIMAVKQLFQDSEIKGLLGKNHSAKIFLVLRTVREVDEVKDARGLLRSIGLKDEELPLALPADTADIQYYFDQFLENNPYGIGALVMSAEHQRQAAMLKRATEWNNVNTQRLDKGPLITDVDVVKSLKDVTVPIVLTTGEKYGLPVYWSNNAPLNSERYYSGRVIDSGAAPNPKGWYNRSTGTIGASSSLVKPGAVDKKPAKVVGGIDLRQMNMLIQPQGSFASSSLDFSLPALSPAEIEVFDLDKELELIQRMASSGIDPIDERLKKYLAVCFARGKTGKEMDDLKLCLEDVFTAQQLDARETPDGYKEVIVIADTRRFVLKESRLAASSGDRINLN